MDKPFTLKVNDLKENIIKLINEANMPCYVLKNAMYEIIHMIEEADGQEITKYFEEMKTKENSKKGDDK